MPITKNTMYRLIFTIMIALLGVALTTTSCGPHVRPYADEVIPPIKRTKPPVDAFALVYVNIRYTPDTCLPPTSKEMCDNVVKNLPPINQGRSGSGLNVWYNNRSYILTAEHVCTEDNPGYVEHGPVSFSVKQDIEIEVTSITGKSLKAKIVAVNKEMDLCALLTDEQFSTPVRLATHPPSLGDRVYAVSAPYGLAGPNFALIFSGFYSGVRKGKHVFTIPTRPGSSGSIVLNKKFEAIGSLHTAYIPLENVGIGAGWEDLRLFMDSIQEPGK